MRHYTFLHAYTVQLGSSDVGARHAPRRAIATTHSANLIASDSLVVFSFKWSGNEYGISSRVLSRIKVSWEANLQILGWWFLKSDQSCTFHNRWVRPVSYSRHRPKHRLLGQMGALSSDKLILGCFTSPTVAVALYQITSISSSAVYPLQVVECVIAKIVFEATAIASRRIADNRRCLARSIILFPLREYVKLFAKWVSLMQIITKAGRLYLCSCVASANFFAARIRAAHAVTIDCIYVCARHKSVDLAAKMPLMRRTMHTCVNTQGEFYRK